MQHFDTRAALATSSVPADVKVARTAGYAGVGDGGAATYLRTNGEPAHAGKVQSADGAWWELYGNEITPEMFGGSATDTNANDIALPAMVAYLGVRGGGVMILDKLYQMKNTRLNVNKPNITITTRRRHVGGIWRRPSGGDSNNGIIFVDGRGSAGDPNERLANNVQIIGIQICGDPGVERSAPDAYFGVTSFNADDVLIEDCYIHDAVNTTNHWNGRRIHVMRNKSRVMVAGGVNIENGCVDCIVAFNDFDDTRDDVIAVLGSVDHIGQLPEFTPYVKPQDIVVIGNIITRTHDFGTPIRIDSSIRVSAVFNQINGCGFAGVEVGTLDADLDEGPARDVVVSGNSITGFGRFWSADDFYAIDPQPSPNPAHIGGISVTAAFNTQIVNNHITTNNQTDHPPFGSIKVDGRCRDVRVKNNVIHGGQGGIAVMDTNFTSFCTNISVVGNEIDGLFAGSFAIIVQKAFAAMAGLLVKDNIIRSPGAAFAVYINNLGSDTGLCAGNVSFNSGTIVATGSPGVTMGVNHTL